MNRRPRGHLVLPAVMTALLGESEEHTGQGKMKVGQLMSPQRCELLPTKQLQHLFQLEGKMCRKCPFLFLFLGFWLGWGTCARQGSHGCNFFPGGNAGSGEALGGGGRGYMTFHFFFGCLILVKLTYWSVLLTPPHLRNFSWLFSSENWGNFQPILPLVRGNQLCKSK